MKHAKPPTCTPDVFVNVTEKFKEAFGMNNETPEARLTPTEALTHLRAVLERMTPGPWLQFSHKYGAVDRGESPQVFRAISEADELGIMWLRNTSAQALAVVEAAEAVLTMNDQCERRLRAIKVPLPRFPEMERLCAALAAFTAAVAEEAQR